MSLEAWMADRIFQRMGVSSTPESKQCLIELFASAREGHLCIPISDSSILPVALWSDGSKPTPCIIENGLLYLHRNWTLETKIYQKTIELHSRAPEPLDRNLYFEGLQQIRERLDVSQFEAISAGFDESFSIITGGPGTGKTYTATHLIRLLASAKKTRFKVVIAASTGKAASHLDAAFRAQGFQSNDLRIEASTLHRLLRLLPGKQRFDSDVVIDADLVVIDEASMLDASLLLHLLSAIGPKTRLLLLGDPDQLPPIESGSLFTQLAAVFGHRLHRSIRMGEGALYALAQAINQGDFEASKSLLLSGNGISFAQLDFSPENRKDLIEKLLHMLPQACYDSEPDPRICLELQSQRRILCGLRQGPLGVNELNRLILEPLLRQESSWVALPILIEQNDAKQNLLNGTTGILIRKKGQRFGKAYFPMENSLRVFHEGVLPRFEIAFCLSVHKSQGSEFEQVTVLFPPGSERFGRELLYTAITRAKRGALLLSNDETLAATLRTPSKRESGFLVRLGKNPSLSAKGFVDDSAC